MIPSFKTRSAPLLEDLRDHVGDMLLKAGQARGAVDYIFSPHTNKAIPAAAA